MPDIDAERQRIAESGNASKDWRRWGPYLSERQWGTVREDYSPYGTAWDYLTHDQARSRAYRWGSATALHVDCLVERTRPDPERKTVRANKRTR